MTVNIISQTGTELIVQAKINLSGSMLEIEENIIKASNEVGFLIFVLTAIPFGLTQAQMAELFQKDRKTITEHIGYQCSKSLMKRALCLF